LGNGTQTADNIPKIINKLSGESIVDISCGCCHSLVLTQTGHVYGFGRNDYGQIGCTNYPHQLTPIKINGFNNEKVISVSCGYEHSLALTEYGEVYGWGRNDLGQLGINNVTHQNTPNKVQNLNDVFIEKIICGQSHSLLLSSVGDIYAFGYNRCGQIGDGNTNNLSNPFKIINSNKFVDIASSTLSNISIAETQNGSCFVWGETINENIQTPRETPIKSMHDIYTNYAKLKITYKIMNIEEKPKTNSVAKSISQLFNNEDYSDFKFKFGNQFIFVNKLILKTRCEYFRSKFSKTWDPKEVTEEVMDENLYKVYFAFLKYIYTDILSDDLQTEEVMDLYNLANSYLEEDLKQKCIQIIKNSITIENVCIFYSLAIKYESQVLENFCFRFASNKLNDVCNTQAFHDLDKQHMDQFITKVALNKLFFK
jgi:RCC1 and BTB domain-containing protein